MSRPGSRRSTSTPIAGDDLADSRASCLGRRRARVAEAWDLREAIVLIGAGDPLLLPGSGDQTVPFRSHPEYFYLTDRECPGAVLAFDPGEGWTDFVPDVTEKQRVWEAAEQAEGQSIAHLGAWLAARRGLPIAMLGCELPGLRFELPRTVALRERMTHVRRPKDSLEIGRIRQAAAATAAGYAGLRDRIRAGEEERTVALELEFAFRRAGADGLAYDTIVGSGPNAAVLHFSPSRRVLADGELVLVDAAAEVGRYVCDVTRTYPAGGTFTGEQRDLHRLVRDIEERAVARCVRGAELVDIHMLAFREATEGLRDLGLVRGEVGDLIERGVTELFFPHGISHFVGLGVRDASGPLPGRKPSGAPGRKLQRTDLPLEPGHVITIEPGIYFIPALLRDPERRSRLSEDVVWSRVDRWLHQGGVRIEDTVHVTSGAPEVVTSAISREVEAAVR